MGVQSLNVKAGCLDGTEIWNIGGQGQCSNRGVCTVNQECVCDEYWSGNADVLALLGHDCQNLVPLEQAFWSVALALTLKLMVIGIKAFKYQYEKYKWVSFKKFLNETRFSYLLCWLLILQPSAIVTCCLKIFTRQQVAVDPPLTIFVILALAVPFLAQTPLALRILHISAGIASQSARETMEKFTTYSYLSNALFVFIYALLFLLPIFSPTTFAFPNTSARVGIIISKACLSVSFGYISHRNYRYITDQLIKVLQSYKHSSNNAQVHGARGETVVKTIERLTLNVETSKKALIVMIIVNALQVIPYMWAYQSYFGAFLFSLSQGKNQPVNWLLPGAEGDHDTPSAADSKGMNSTSIVTPTRPYSSKMNINSVVAKVPEKDSRVVSSEQS